MIIIEEMKKILSWKRLLLLLGFAVMYFMIFLKPFVQMNPGSYHQFADKTKEMIQEYGSRMTPEVFSQFKAEVQDMKAHPGGDLEKVDDYIRKNELCASYDIFDLDSFFGSGMEDLTREQQMLLWDELYKGLTDVEIYQAQDQNIDISAWVGAVELYEQEVLFASRSENGTQFYDNLSEAQRLRVSQRNKDELYGILPPTILDSHLEVLQFAGAFMLLSVIFLIVPYVVGDNRSRLVDFQYTSVKGRRFYLYKLLAAICSAVLIMAVQVGALAGIFKINAVTDFWNSPVSSFQTGFISWFSLTLGQLTLLAVGLCVVLGVGMVLVVFAVTRYCVNYITAIAWQLPLVVLAGLFGGILMKSFTEITSLKYMPMAVGIGGFAVGAAAVAVQYVVERKKNM